MWPLLWGSMTATLPHNCAMNQITSQPLLLSPHIIIAIIAIFSLSSKFKKIVVELEMAALASPTSLHGAKSIAPANTTGTGLRAAADRYALKSSFFSPSVHLFMPSRISTLPLTAPKFSMRVASKQAYICRDCGYIYNDRTPFEKVADNYFCPVCGAPKRRFRAYTPDVSKNANSTDVRKARKEQLKRDEAIGQALPFAVALGVAALVGLYFYLNSTF